MYAIFAENGYPGEIRGRGSALLSPTALVVVAAGDRVKLP